MSSQDTIAAIATAPGQGGIGVIRLSGEHALSIAQALVGKSLESRHAHYCSVRCSAGTVLDTGIAIFFPGPSSFTGEDVVELQVHGGPVILDLIVQEACALGARPAAPGEFSERAFLNDKIDLAQAEAIADLISSSTQEAALNASRSLRGAFSARINELVEEVTRLRVYIEAAIDFPEEEIDFITDGNVTEQLQTILARFDEVAAQAKQGSLTREGMKLVIAGRPNAGKSSLLNALSGQETAIVTPIEGTTRDVLREDIQIDGMPLHIVDTAGLRDSDDEIEQEGVRRAWREMDSADRILLVIDGSDPGAQTEPEKLWPERRQKLSRDIPVTVVVNKCDLSGREPCLEETVGGSVLHMSAKTGIGMDLLRRHLKTAMGYEGSVEGGFSARRRHLRSLAQAREFLLAGQEQLEHAGAGELLAEDLRQCQYFLGEITGQVSSDELLGEIFSSFCIGK
jgi:tRNA modification GTPase